MLTGLLLIGAVLVGSAIGLVMPAAAAPADAVVDPLILVMLVLLLTSLRIGDRSSLRLGPRTVAVACGLNFLLVPVVALAIGYALVPDVDALRVGLLLYCLFPCTDWFLGFTRLSGGDTALGAALIPVNLTIQLGLFPFYLHLLAGATGAPLGLSEWSSLLTWFAVPAGLALGVRLLLRPTPRAETAVLIASERLVPGVLAALVAAIFCANVATVADHPGPFLRVLLAVCCFLAVTWAVGEFVIRRAALPHPQRALVVMTTSARNAPLVLGLTVVALPDQPLIHAAIVLGMLVEFPHLTALQQMLRRAAPAAPMAKEQADAAIAG